MEPLKRLNAKELLQTRKRVQISRASLVYDYNAQNFGGLTTLSLKEMEQEYDNLSKELQRINFECKKRGLFK